MALNIHIIFWCSFSCNCLCVMDERIWRILADGSTLQFCINTILIWCHRLLCIVLLYFLLADGRPPFDSDNTVTIQLNQVIEPGVFMTSCIIAGLGCLLAICFVVFNFVKRKHRYWVIQGHLHAEQLL